jgi:hypothetical protein
MKLSPVFTCLETELFVLNVVDVPLSNCPTGLCHLSVLGQGSSEAVPLHDFLICCHACMGLPHFPRSQGLLQLFGPSYLQPDASPQAVVSARWRY